MDEFTITTVFYFLYISASVVISGTKSDFKECCGEFSKGEAIEYGLYSIFDWMCRCKQGSFQGQIDRETFESKIGEYISKIEKSPIFRDRLFGRVGIRLVTYAYNHKNWLGTLFNIAILWSCVCYNTLDVIFALCFLMAALLHYNYEGLLDYMELVHKVVYYAIPVGSFFLLLFAIGAIRMKVDWPLVRNCFIVAFVLGLTFAIVNNDWSKAEQRCEKDMYEYEMEKKYGENWEDILGLAERDSIEAQLN